MNTLPQVRIEAVAQEHSDIAELSEFQGELKSLSKESYEKLKKQILEHGFSFPFFVWKDGGALRVLDGHQRLRALRKMREEGFGIPRVPFVEVKAKDEKEAKLKLLGAASQYGEVSKQGLYEYIENAGIKFEELSSGFRFSEISLASFGDEFYREVGSPGEVSALQGTISDPQPQTNQPSPGEAKTENSPGVSNVRMLQLFLDDSTHPEAVQKLTELMEKYGKDNISDTVLEIAREAHRTHFPAQ